VSELAVSVERRADVLVVRLQGHLDIYTVPVLRSRLSTAARTQTPLVLDLRRVTLLDSSGLGALIGLRNRAVAAGRRLGLVSDDAHLRELLVIAGLHQVFVHARDVDTACSLLSPDGAGEMAARPGPAR
jgi:anti-anti-sigma factor